MRENVSLQYYKDRFNYTFKPGSVVVFRDAGIMHIGLITEISEKGNYKTCKLIEADTDGRPRVRDLEWEIKEGGLEPLLPMFADNLHTAKWDEWRSEHGLS